MISYVTIKCYSILCSLGCRTAGPLFPNVDTQAQGGLIDMKKRKPVGMAFHWFLPQPFGTEARRSRLAPNDPMRYSHKPHQSSPMFVDLAQPKAAEIRLPDDVDFEV